MVIMQTIVEDIVDRLSNAHNIGDLLIVPAFSGNINPKTLTRGTISVGVSELEIGNQDETVASFKRPYTAKIKLSFYYPYSGGIFKMQEMIDLAYTILLFSKARLDIKNVRCGAPRFKRELDAIIIDSEFVLEGDIFG